MPRETQAQKREREALVAFEESIALINDPRRPQGIRYPLSSIVIISLMAMVCGANDAEAIQAWGEVNIKWLKTFLKLPHGAPTQDVVLLVFASLNPQEFSRSFLCWMELLKSRLNTKENHISIDGKTSRGSLDSANGRPAVHTVSAWLSEAGLVIGQQKTREKSNEITAIPELLQIIDIRGSTITIDAMGCQTAIASSIKEGGGEYLLAVKENQPTLHEDIQVAFYDALKDGSRPLDDPAIPLETFTEINKGHGRLEERTVHISHDLSWISTASRWCGLAFIAMVISIRTNLTTGKTSMEKRYYIGSDKKTSVKEIAKYIRRHWSIENELHWVLDMAFREDEARHRAQHCADNFATLRHFAMNILKSDKKRKVGIANTRKRAGWDHSYLLKLLTGC